MSETLGGVVKEAWSKSVMLGLLAIARRQKRDLAVIHFSGPNQLQARVFPKGESSPLELIDAVEFFFGGGTVFDRWMEEAARFVDQDLRSGRRHRHQRRHRLRFNTDRGRVVEKKSGTQDALLRRPDRRGSGTRSPRPYQ